MADLSSLAVGKSRRVRVTAASQREVIAGGRVRHRAMLQCTQLFTLIFGFTPQLLAYVLRLD